MWCPKWAEHNKRKHGSGVNGFSTHLDKSLPCAGICLFSCVFFWITWRADPDLCWLQWRKARITSVRGRFLGSRSTAKTPQTKEKMMTLKIMSLCSLPWGGKPAYLSQPLLAVCGLVAVESYWRSYYFRHLLHISNTGKGQHISSLK